MSGAQVESRFKVFEEIENALAGKIGERVLVVKRGIHHQKRASDNTVVHSWHVEEWFIGRLNANILLTEPDCGIIFVPVEKHVRAKFPYGNQKVVCDVTTSPIRLNVFDDDGAIETVIPPREAFDLSVRNAPPRSVQVVISDDPIRSFVANKGKMAAHMYFCLNAQLHRSG